MNDLKEKAVLSFLNQNYPTYHLYLLDDSTILEEQIKADKFEVEHPEHVSVIRRPNRRAFKAGNLNYALEQIKHIYKYFAVMDADEIVPPHFLSETVAIAESNPSIGFIQTCHKQYGDTTYGQKTGDGIDLHWSYFLPARNRFGFVYFYGHGALIRTKACLEAGGFPEIVAEDVALAAKMREVGYHGYYADDIICYEETPSSYAAWRKRNGKVVRGTLEFLTRVFPSFARSDKVSTIEKLDLLISSSILFLPVLFLCFLVLLHGVMPFFMKDSYSISCSQFGAPDRGYIHTAMGLFRPLWGWDTLLFTIFTIFAPLCYLIPNLIRSPLKVTQHIWRMTAIHLSGTIHIFSETLGWLLTHRAVFNATGNNTKNHKKTLGINIEGTIGLLILTCSVFTGSLCLMAVGLSTALVPLLTGNNMKGRLCATLVLLPMALILLTFFVIPLHMLGITGVLVGVAFAHH
jgi:cellulose synthase/poly-beta-1,6-N-acetylglucosamine synthase-like glycosyltransferase